MNISDQRRQGILRTSRQQTSKAAGLVRGFLSAMEARDLARAKTFLGEGFVMTFPGGVQLRTLEELIAWAAERYRSIGKTYAGFEELPPQAGGRTVVYCFGTLHGEWPDGRAFSGIRFIDRFTVGGGRLLDQQVWNDLAESRTP